MFQTQTDLSTSTMLSAFFSTQQTSSFSFPSGNPFTIIRTAEKRKTPYINDQPEILNPDKKLQTSSHNYATIPQKAPLTEEKRTRSARTTIFEKTPKSDRVFHQVVKERPEETINDIFSFFFNGNTSSPSLQNHAKSLIRDQPSITDFINQSETFEEFKASEVFSTPVKEAKATQAYSELTAHIAFQESTAVTEQDPTPPSSPIYNEIPQVSIDGEEKIVSIKTGDNYQISNAYIASLQNAPRKRREIKAKWEPEDNKTQILAKFEEQACKVLKFEVVGDEKAIKVMDEFEWDLELATKTIKRQAGKYSSALNPKFLPKYETRSNRG